MSTDKLKKAAEEYNKNVQAAIDKVTSKANTQQEKKIDFMTQYEEYKKKEIIAHLDVIASVLQETGPYLKAGRLSASDKAHQAGIKANEIEKTEVFGIRTRTNQGNIFIYPIPDKQKVAVGWSAQYRPLQVEEYDLKQVTYQLLESLSIDIINF